MRPQCQIYRHGTYDQQVSGVYSSSANRAWRVAGHVGRTARGHARMGGHGGLTLGSDSMMSEVMAALP